MSVHFLPGSAGWPVSPSGKSNSAGVGSWLSPNVGKDIGFCSLGTISVPAKGVNIST